MLCGRDAASGKDYEHRKAWIRSRLEFLVGQFAIDVLGYSVLSNHFHVVLRNRPDIVLGGWSDDEIVPGGGGTCSRCGKTAIGLAEPGGASWAAGSRPIQTCC